MLVFGVYESLALNVINWVAIVLLNYSMSIGVQHLHTHRKLFTSPFLNRVTEILLTLPGGVSYPVMKYIHVHLHHRYDNGAGDPTSTVGKETGLAALRYWISYGWISQRATAGGLFAPDAKPALRRLRGQLVVDHLIQLAFVAAILVYDPRSMLLFYLIPYVIVSVNIGYFAWLTHAPAREGTLNGSINSANNWMNIFVHNQGYHTLHHIKPSIHWTAIPEYFEVMDQVDADLIVPYWVTLDTSYRLARPDSFRDPRFGSRWKQQLAQRVRDGKKRLGFLPYFGWI
jgi:fatty acid desaturase